MRPAMLVAVLTMVACAIEEVDDVEETTIERGAVDPATCEDLGDQLDCLAAGCRWQTLFGVSFTSDGTCEIGPPWGLCYAPELGQPCDAQALLCDEGMHAWVLPAPDNAVVMTLSATSCGVPEHFLPCEDPSYRENLVAPDAVTTPRLASAPSDAEELLARACECGCAGPQ